MWDWVLSRLRVITIWTNQWSNTKPLPLKLAAAAQRKSICLFSYTCLPSPWTHFPTHFQDYIWVNVTPLMTQISVALAHMKVNLVKKINKNQNYHLNMSIKYAVLLFMTIWSTVSLFLKKDIHFLTNNTFDKVCGLFYACYCFKYWISKSKKEISLCICWYPF